MSERLSKKLLPPIVYAKDRTITTTTTTTTTTTSPLIRFHLGNERLANELLRILRRGPENNACIAVNKALKECVPL